MTRYKMKNGGRVPFTQAEETQRDAEEALWTAGQPMREWEDLMSQTDISIPRPLEDIYDALTITEKGNVSQETKDKIDAKKALRAQRPMA